MKRAALTMMAAIAPLTAQAREPQLNPERMVIVCMENAIGLAESSAAQRIASGMFARIGVTLRWHVGLRGCPERGILVNLGDHTSETLLPGALAYALPYEGTHIHVFYDRIANTQVGRVLPRVLAHVLVHEITHILEGTNRHSASGVMKAHWTAGDFSLMAGRTLDFSSEDIRLINYGLAARTAGVTRLQPVSQTDTATVRGE